MLDKSGYYATYLGNVVLVLNFFKVRALTNIHLTCYPPVLMLGFLFS